MTDQTHAPSAAVAASGSTKKRGLLGLGGKDLTLFLVVVFFALAAPFVLNPFPEDTIMAKFNAGYPDLMQRFVIFGIFAVGFNILFGLTGYLSFGHAAFLGVGSYAAIWMMKLLTTNILLGIVAAIILAGLFALLVGYISLRRSGIYFSILTLAFAQMSYSLAYSVLTPITGGETGLQLKQTDNRSVDYLIYRAGCATIGGDQSCSIVNIGSASGALAAASAADLEDEMARLAELNSLAEAVDQNGDVIPLSADDAQELAALRSLSPISEQQAQRLVVAHVRELIDTPEEATSAADAATSMVEGLGLTDQAIADEARQTITGNLEALADIPEEALGHGTSYYTDVPTAGLLGLDMKTSYVMDAGNWKFTFNVGYYICAVFLIVAFYLSIRLFRSPFGMMLRAVKSNQHRMNYTGLNPRPYALAAFVISGMYAGLAGGLLVAMDTQAGPERMFWTDSGEVVLMTILGGTGTLIGPILGAGFINYFENIVSAIGKKELTDWFPCSDVTVEGVTTCEPTVFAEIMIAIIYPFTGSGWHLTLGLIFMLVVIFLPGGLVEGVQRLGRIFTGKRGASDDSNATAARAGE